MKTNLSLPQMYKILHLFSLLWAQNRKVNCSVQKYFDFRWATTDACWTTGGASPPWPRCWGWSAWRWIRSRRYSGSSPGARSTLTILQTGMRRNSVAFNIFVFLFLDLTRRTESWRSWAMTICSKPRQRQRQSNTTLGCLSWQDNTTCYMSLLWLCAIKEYVLFEETIYKISVKKSFLKIAWLFSLLQKSYTQRSEDLRCKIANPPQSW